MTDKRKRSKKKTSKKKKIRSKSKSTKKAWKWAGAWRFALKASAFLLVVFFFYVLYLDSVIRYQFEGKRWALPAHVYARPLELYPNLTLSADQLEQELGLLGYRSSLAGGRAGSYLRRGDEIRIITRPFLFWDGPEDSAFIRVDFKQGKIHRITDLNQKNNRALVRLDPYRYATIFPSHKEDRLLIQRDALPPMFVEGLMAVEDRHFYEHHGIDFKGLARALWVNLKSFDLVQGGSTLTQQLVKNFFLSHERTLSRKIKEALMAGLLEVHYEKDDILEAYVNEVYLGQDGGRAIHGFSLGAQFYFGASLESLSVEELALLIGLVKGPSYYDPRRFPERALKRRNQVLNMMADQGVISNGESRRAKQASLGVKPKGGSASRFPAFVDLVRQQLARDYREEDLRSEGLQIFTTLDPLLQMSAERGVERRLTQLEQQKDLAALQSAVVMTSPGSGEVLALVGDRTPGAAGFNRAIHAKRQVGSLIKPAVYLTALAQQGYTLTSPLQDEPLDLPVGNGDVWSPENFDKNYLGQIPFYRGLVDSRNVPTIRLGLDVGVKAVSKTLSALGIEDELPPYPSLFLGAVELSPLQIAQMYQSLADGGFYTPLRTIRTVVAQDRSVLQRYDLNVEQVADATSVYLVNDMLQRVVRDGTGRSLNNLLHANYDIAGKTGTSNDGRDSWFAGFSGNRLAVAWVGRDDNQPTSLTGAQGAMRVWADVMASAGLESLQLVQPGQVEALWVNPVSNHLVSPKCETAVALPFITGTGPTSKASCDGQTSQNWLQGIFQ